MWAKDTGSRERRGGACQVEAVEGESAGSRGCPSLGGLGGCPSRGGGSPSCSSVGQRAGSGAWPPSLPLPSLPAHSTLSLNTDFINWRVLGERPVLSLGEPQTWLRALVSRLIE